MEKEITKLVVVVGNITAIGFIISTAALALISILGIWDFFDADVIEKSFATLGLLVFVTVIVLVAAKYLGKTEIFTPWGIFSSIQRITVGTLILSSGLLALVGVLSIWEVLKDISVGKTIASLAIIVFTSFITIVICLERKGSQLTKQHLSPGRMIGWAIFIFILFWFLSTFRFGLF